MGITATEVHTEEHRSPLKSRCLFIASSVNVKSILIILSMFSDRLARRRWLRLEWLIADLCQTAAN
jgi:hypothetical protein